MVLLNSTRYFNRWLGPFLLRNGVRLRSRLVAPGTDHPHLDAMLGITLGQWLTALEARDHANDIIEERQSSSSTPLSLDEEADIRVQVLQESYLRPALLPHASWEQDVAPHWQFYPRLVRWLRLEYLKARFGPHVRAARSAYPALVQSPQFSFTVPPTFANLPKTSLVQSTLCSTSNVNGGSKKTKGKRTDTTLRASSSFWATSKHRDRLVRDMQRMAARYGGHTHVERGGALCWNELPAASSNSTDTPVSLAKIPLADLLQLVGANVHVCGPINTWLEQFAQFQFCTREYIAELGDYLMQRCNKSGHPMVILEVGAGDGLLTALLQDYVENHHAVSSKTTNASTTTMTAKLRRAGQGGSSQSPPTTFVATDDESWSIRKKATVVKLDFRQALEQHSTDNLIVLCSWMPMNDDWTAVFRKYENVHEYILIGEADDGQCGDGWETWGNPHFTDDESTKRPAPFEVDGFERHDLAFLLPYQFSRYDSAVSKEGTTVSFRRKLQN